MTVPNRSEIFVENLSKKGSTALKETLSTSPHQPLCYLVSTLPAALHFSGMCFSTGRNTSSRCTQSLFNLSSNQHTDAKHATDLLFTNCCAHSHNGGEKILCLFGDWLVMRNEKCNPDTTTKARRVKILEQMAWKVCEISITGGFWEQPRQRLLSVELPSSWGRSVQQTASQDFSHLFSVAPKVSCSLKHSRHICTQDLPCPEVFQRQAAHQVNAFSTDCLVCITVPSS